MMSYQDGMVVFDTDLNKILAAVEKSGIHKGYAVTQQSTPAMGVTVALGEAFVKQSYIVKTTSTDVNLDAAHTMYPRKDIIVIKSNKTITKVTGTAEAASPTGKTGPETSRPKPPNIPDDAILLAEVWVAAGATTILNADIVDRRVFLEPSKKFHLRLATVFESADAVPQWCSVHAWETGKGRILGFVNKMAAYQSTVALYDLTRFPVKIKDVTLPFNGAWSFGVWKGHGLIAVGGSPLTGEEANYVNEWRLYKVPSTSIEDCSGWTEFTDNLNTLLNNLGYTGKRCIKYPQIASCNGLGNTLLDAGWFNPENTAFAFHNGTSWQVTGITEPYSYIQEGHELLPNDDWITEGHGTNTFYVKSDYSARTWMHPPSTVFTTSPLYIPKKEKLLWTEWGSATGAVQHVHWSDVNPSVPNWVEITPASPYARYYGFVHRQYYNADFVPVCSSMDSQPITGIERYINHTVLILNLTTDTWETFQYSPLFCWFPPHAGADLYDSSFNPTYRTPPFIFCGYMGERTDDLSKNVLHAWKGSTFVGGEY